MRILVEGWRGVPHSYCVVNQRQCAELLKLPDVELYHRDMPYFGKGWRRREGVFPRELEAAVASLPAPPESLPMDAVLRVAYPYDFSPPRSGALLVFATAEYGTPAADCLAGGEGSFAEAAARAGAWLVTPSNWSRDALLAAGAPAGRVRVVPHGVDPAVQRPASPSVRRALREAFGWEGSFVFLNVGAMTPNKGVGLLLKACATLALEGRRLRLALKGMDDLYQSSRLLAGLGGGLSAAEVEAVGPLMEYHGGSLPEESLAAMYQAADAYVSPYLAEGFNLPVLEAAACGTPALCSRGGPTDDFVDDAFALRIDSAVVREDGAVKCLAPSQEHLAAQMRRVMDDPAFRARAASASPAWAHGRFSWGKVAAGLLDVIREAAG